MYAFKKSLPVILELNELLFSISIDRHILLYKIRLSVCVCVFVCLTGINFQTRRATDSKFSQVNHYLMSPIVSYLIFLRNLLKGTFGGEPPLNHSQGELQQNHAAWESDYIFAAPALFMS